MTKAIATLIVLAISCFVGAFPVGHTLNLLGFDFSYMDSVIAIASVWFISLCVVPGRKADK